MSGYYGFPFRAPADGWGTPKPSVYFAAGQSRTALTNLSAYTLTYANVEQPPDGSLGDPYTRLVDMCCGTDPMPPCTTELGHDTLAGAGCPHVPWIGGSTGSPNFQYIGGTFPQPTLTPSGTADLSLCRHVGFKNVQAKRQWHGTFGFLPADQCNDSTVNCNGTVTPYRSYKSQGDQTKFTKATYNVAIGSSYDNTALEGLDLSPLARFPIFDAINTYAGHAYPDGIGGHLKLFGSCNIYQGSNIVEKASGVLSFGIHNYASNTDGFAPDHPTVGVAIDGVDPITGNFIGDQVIYPLPTSPNCQADVDTTSAYVYPSNGSDPFTADWVSYNPNDYLAYGIGTTVESSQTYSLTTNTHIEWVNVYMTAIVREDYWGIEGVGGISFSCGTIDFGDVDGDTAGTYENTAVEVQSDMDALCKTWNLKDDVVYPWRFDSNQTIAPLVTRREVQANVSPCVYKSYYMEDYRNPINDEYNHAPWTYDPLLYVPHTGTPLPSNYATWTPVSGQGADWVVTWGYMARGVDGVWKNNSPDTPAGVVGNTFISNAVIHNGGIVGAPLLTENLKDKDGNPLPAGGVIKGNYFSPEMKKWELCDGAACSPPAGGKTWVDRYSGVVNTGQFGIPLAATLWTDEYEAATYTLSGAWVTDNFDMNNGGNTVVPDRAWRCQKYAEIKLLWDSYDFNQPYGTELFSLNQSKTYCFASESGDTITVMRTAVGQDAPSNGDLMVVNGGTHSGVYTISSVRDGVGVIGSGQPGISFNVTRLVSDLPADYATGIAGVLQFNAQLKPNMTTTLPDVSSWQAAAPFGLNPVSGAVVAGGNTTFTLGLALDNWVKQYVTVVPDGTGGITTLQVDLYAGVTNASGVLVPANTPFAGNVTLTKTSATTASVAGDLSAAKWVVPTGKRPWWYDNGQKGDCVAYGWTLDRRTAGEAARLTGLNCGGNFPSTPYVAGGLTYNADGTRNYGYGMFTATPFSLKFTPCCYTVMAFTNNGETWNNAYVTPIPKIVADETYGAVWQGEFVQAAQSPIWQQPHKRCGEYRACPTDTIDVYDPFYQIMKPDDGSCLYQEPTAGVGGCKFYVDFYAYPAQVEPFLTLPATNQTIAPDPFALWGLKWKAYSPVTNDPANPPADGTVMSAPLRASSSPWVLWRNVCARAATGVDCELVADATANYSYWVNC